MPDVIDMESPVDWLMLMIVVFFLIISPFAIRKHWRGDSMAADFMSAGYWYKSEALRRGHRRATIAIFIAGYALFELGAAMFGLPPSGPGDIDWLSIVIIFVLLQGFVGFVLYWLVILWNVPKLVVAPHLRNEPGLLASGG